MILELKGQVLKKGDVCFKYPMSDSAWTRFKNYAVSKGVKTEGLSYKF